MKVGHKIVITDCTISSLVGKMGTIVEVDRGNHTTIWPFLAYIDNSGSYWCDGVIHNSLIEELF